MGSPSFLHAFSTHFRMMERGDLVQSPLNLRSSTHPVTWLRVQLLAARATAAGFAAEAQIITNEWEAVAQAMGIVEEYHGYFDATIGTHVNQTIEDMLIEAAPRPCTDEEVAGGDWQMGSDSLVRLLNWAWQQYLADPVQYAGWESSIIQRFLAIPAAMSM
jgi:phosphotransferase system IIB component